jgi:hypothetical protein
VEIVGNGPAKEDWIRNHLSEYVDKVNAEQLRRSSAPAPVQKSAHSKKIKKMRSPSPASSNEASDTEAWGPEDDRDSKSVEADSDVETDDTFEASIKRLLALHNQHSRLKVAKVKKAAAPATVKKSVKKSAKGEKTSEKAEKPPKKQKKVIVDEEEEAAKEAAKKKRKRVRLFLYMSCQKS